MDSSDAIWQLLRNLLYQLPSTLALMGCIVLAISRWKRHPTVSLLAMISLLLLLLHGLIFAAVYVWVPNWFIQGRFTETTSLQRFLTLLGLIYNATLAVGFGLLLLSIFMQRRAAATGS
jgi:hypothetical protein